MAEKIKFVGPEGRLPFPDPLYGTGLVWLTPEDEHLVAGDVAAKMLKHTDVWATSGHVDDATATALGLERPAVKPEEPSLQPPLVQLDQMDKAALTQYAQQYFNQVPKGNIGQMRSQIRNWLNDSKHE